MSLIIAKNWVDEYNYIDEQNLVEYCVYLAAFCGEI